MSPRSVAIGCPSCSQSFRESLEIIAGVTLVCPSVGYDWPSTVISEGVGAAVARVRRKEPRKKACWAALRQGERKALAIVAVEGQLKDASSRVPARRASESSRVAPINAEFLAGFGLASYAQPWT